MNRNDERPPGKTIGRRGALAAGAGLVVALGGGRSALAAAAAGSATRPGATPPGATPPGGAPTRKEQPHPAVRAGYRFLDAAMDAYPHYGAVRLLQSYADEAGLYSTAYAYDSALAALAYLAEGSAASTERARLIGVALLYAQAHDPGYRDGRLRQSYTVGPYVRNGIEQTNGFVDPDGNVNAGNAFDHNASLTSDQAWAGLALLALARRTVSPAFLPAALNLGNWIDTTCGTNQALGGYLAGISATGAVLTRTETTHNAVVAAFFGQLAAMTGDAVWIQRRTRAARFVHQMWQPDGGFYAAGSDDGKVAAQCPVTTQAQTWPTLALHGTDSPAHPAALACVKTKLTVVDNAERIHSSLPHPMTISGVTFSDRSRLVDLSVPLEPGRSRPDPDAVWLEGTAQLAAALLARGAPGDLAAATIHLNTLADVQRQRGLGQRVADRPLPPGIGILAASSPLHTGVGNTGYYPARHVGTTAWFLLAMIGANPFALTGAAAPQTA